MEKAQLLKFVEEHKVMKKDEFETLYNKTFEEMKNRKLPVDQLETYTIARMQAALKKRIRQAKQTFEAIFFGNFGVTDFGVSKKYNDILKRWNDANEENKRKMIAIGEISPTGEPLYTSPAWRVGKTINIKENNVEQFILLARKDKTEEWKEARLSVIQPKGKVPPYFKLSQIQVTVQEKKNVDSKILHLITDDLEFTLFDAQEINFKEYALKYFAKDCLNLSDLDTAVDKYKDARDSFTIVKGNVSRINVLERSTMIELDDQDLSLETAKTIVCWVNNSWQINFDENAMNVFILGRPYTKQDKDGNAVVNIQVHGIYVPEEFRVMIPDKVTNDKIVERIEEKPGGVVW